MGYRSTDGGTDERAFKVTSSQSLLKSDDSGCLEEILERSVPSGKNRWATSMADGWLWEGGGSSVGSSPRGEDFLSDGCSPIGP